MTITGRITADAVVNTLKDERKVVNFSVAMNDSYKPKGGERQNVTTYCNCSYWISDRIAPFLTKGAVIELTGRVYVTPYISKDGVAKASLNCHVSNVKFLARPKEVQVIGRPTEAAGSTNNGGDDTPFLALTNSGATCAGILSLFQFISKAKTAAVPPAGYK